MVVKPSCANRQRRRASWIAAPSLAIALLLTGCAADRAIDAELQATATAEIARQPALYSHGDARAWLVRRDGMDRGLLWGTMHVGYSGETVLPAPIRARFYAAADLTVESVIDQTPPTAMQKLRRAIQRANAAADPAALEHLDPATRLALDDALPERSARHLSLRGLANAVTAAAAAEAPGPMPVLGFVDLNLMAFARDEGHPVLGLEEPQSPDPTLAAPNGADAADLLRLSLRRAPAIRAMAAWVRAAYGRGDVAQAVAALVAWRASAPDLARSDRDRPALLTRRTAAWLPELETTLARPGLHFIAVGAGHLIGEDGLVSLLRQQGYQVLACRADRC